MIVYNVKKQQWKFHQNQIRLRGLNACFSVFGTAKKAFLGPFRHQKQLNYDILHLTVEQTCLMIKKWCELRHPPLDSPQKKNQKTVSGDPKNYHLGCLGYPKEHQTKSFQGKILKKVIFYAKIEHFLAYLTFFLFT